MRARPHRPNVDKLATYARWRFAPTSRPNSRGAARRFAGGDLRSTHERLFAANKGDSKRRAERFAPDCGSVSEQLFVESLDTCGRIRLAGGGAFEFGLVSTGLMVHDHLKAGPWWSGAEALTPFVIQPERIETTPDQHGPGSTRRRPAARCRATGGRRSGPARR